MSIATLSVSATIGGGQSKAVPMETDRETKPLPRQRPQERHRQEGNVHQPGASIHSRIGHCQNALPAIGAASEQLTKGGEEIPADDGVGVDDQISRIAASLQAAEGMVETVTLAASRRVDSLEHGAAQLFRDGGRPVGAVAGHHHDIGGRNGIVTGENAPNRARHDPLFVVNRHDHRQPDIVPSRRGSLFRTRKEGGCRQKGKLDRAGKRDKEEHESDKPEEGINHR
jgi:hypothetical protein